MPEISRFYGIIIYMYICDHQPPHFHVIYNEYECWITISDRVITGNLPKRAERLVSEWLDLHKQELLDNWNRLQNSESPIKISPLE